MATKRRKAPAKASRAKPKAGPAKRTAAAAGDTAARMADAGLLQLPAQAPPIERAYQRMVVGKKEAQEATAKGDRSAAPEGNFFVEPMTFFAGRRR
ncbi:MAG: hypothetical protein E6G97_24945 [Alphaproteobacteria bacterium]|nr:MAG: hypothetical protein E6G97_24945 [Alphaproteobacteria bacterium]